VNAPVKIDAPVGLLAELTHRCPLQCPYCSNPLELDRKSAELDTETWKRVFTEAHDLGVLQVHLSGGEPTARDDIVEIVRHCAGLGLYSNLITSGVLLSQEKLMALIDAGLDHVQLSLQDVDPVNADQIGGFKGGHQKKIALGTQVVKAGLPLTVNAVIHRRNIDTLPMMIELAESMGAKRVEVAHTQYYGWALANRAALMPSWEQVKTAIKVVEEARERLKGRMVIDQVVPDYYARYPKPCMGGWASRALNVTPAGKVLPCHAAESIPGLVFQTVREKSLGEIWYNSDAFNAYRGNAWMEEPCTSCERAPTCRGGCRCQAMLLAGNAAAADPACHLSPFHQQMHDLAVTDAASGNTAFRYRKIGG
jgi:pyrroloquinoline quinone biosynthesis protein E